LSGKKTIGTGGRNASGKKKEIKVHPRGENAISLYAKGGAQREEDKKRKRVFKKRERKISR